MLFAGLPQSSLLITATAYDEVSIYLVVMLSFYAVLVKVIYIFDRYSCLTLIALFVIVNYEAGKYTMHLAWLC